MSNSEIRVAPDDLRRFVKDIFFAAGLSEGHAEIEADVLVWADLRGVGSHGVFRVPMYLAWMARGNRNPKAEIRVVMERGASCVIDANRAPGLVTMKTAMEKAVEIARRQSVGWVLVRETTHTGAMGYYAHHAAEQGLVGITACASRPLMAYHGARAAALGTNPLAIGVPRADGPPLILDMSSAAIAWGKLAQARARGEALPGGAALDAAGRPTTDPDQATVPLPLGGPKGSGLSLMIECVTSLLAGVPLLAPALEDAGEMTDFIQNALAVAVDPAAFGDGAAFAEEVDRLARQISALPRAEGIDEILLPGERGAREMERRRRDGIPLSGDLWHRLTEIADELGVAPPPR